jgi:hypothetical protein
VIPGFSFWQVASACLALAISAGVGLGAAAAGVGAGDAPPLEPDDEVEVAAGLDCRVVLGGAT